MKYYRKAAAVFIAVITLLLPLFMEAESKVAVVNFNKLVETSETLSSMAAKNKESELLEQEIRKLVKSAAAEYAANKSYSSVITKHVLYQGGFDITLELAKKIDKENNLD